MRSKIRTRLIKNVQGGNQSFMRDLKHLNFIILLNYIKIKPKNANS